MKSSDIGRRNMSTNPVWLFDERKHTGSNFEDEAVVKAYDRHHQNIRDIQGEIKGILEFLDLKKDQTVLEIGTGTGEFAIAVAGLCSSVTAIDISPQMLRFAGEKAASRGVKNIDFRPGGFLSFEHEGAPFDAIVTQLALHHLPDFWKQVALLRLSGMLKKGGRFFLRDAIYSFDPMDYESFFNHFIEATDGKSGKDAAANVGIVSHIKNEFSTLDWIIEGMIRKADLSIERCEKGSGFISAYFCVKI